MPMYTMSTMSTKTMSTKLGENFQKNAQKRLFRPVFPIYACGAKKIGQNGVFLVHWEN